MNVTLHSKRDFADVIKLKILRWKHYCGLVDGPYGPQGSLEMKNGGKGVRVRERAEDFKMALKMEEGDTSQGIRLQKVRKPILH